MAGLLGDIGDFIYGDDTTKDAEGRTQYDRRQPYFQGIGAGLGRMGGLLMAAGMPMHNEQRAQLMAQMGGALGGIPGDILAAEEAQAKGILQQQTIATSKNKLENQARIRAYAATPEGQEALAKLQPHERFAAKIAIDGGDIDAFSRIMNSIGTHEARAATLTLQEKALELKRLQQEQGGLFKGTGPEVQMYNFLSKADPGSQEYLIAYNYLSKPRTLPDGSKVEGMDLRAYPVPTFSRLPGAGAPSGTPPAPQPPPDTGGGGPAPAPSGTPPAPAPGGTPPPPAPGVPGPVVAPPGSLPVPPPPTPPTAPPPGGRPPAPPPNLTPDQIGLTLRPGTSITQPNGTAITRGLDGTVRIDYPDGQSTTQAPNSPKVTEGAPKIDPTDARKLSEFKTEQAKLNLTGQDFLREWAKATPGDRAKAMLGQPTPLSAAWTNFAMLAKGSALFNLGVITGPDKQLLESALANPASLRSMGVSEADVEKQMRKLLAILDTGVREHEKNLLNPPKAPKPGAAPQPKVRNYNPATGQFE